MYGGCVLSPHSLLAKLNTVRLWSDFGATADSDGVLASDLIREVIFQTRETVFHRDIQTPRRELKIRRAADYF